MGSIVVVVVVVVIFFWPRGLFGSWIWEFGGLMMVVGGRKVGGVWVGL